jgi:hypothetical protein
MQIRWPGFRLESACVIQRHRRLGMDRDKPKMLLEWIEVVIAME